MYSNLSQFAEKSKLFVTFYWEAMNLIYLQCTFTLWVVRRSNITQILKEGRIVSLGSEEDV